MELKVDLKEKSYPIIIRKGIINDVGEEVLNIYKGKKIFIITDDNVKHHYGNTVMNSLKNSGYNVEILSLKPGEETKSFNTLPSVYNAILNFNLTRSDLIIALGGGVIGDLAGFVASTYLRGVDFIQIPTSLLAQVDSSVGGKVAVDLERGKNLVGSFYHPKCVLIDPEVLKTLEERFFIDGMAEVIKYGVLYDRELFEHLSTKGLDFNREEVIARCVELKRNVVAEDEFDTGARQKLNLGHTIGHAIETCSGYTVSHGKAVAMGIAIVSRATKCLDTDRILALLNRFGLPTCCDYSAEALANAAMLDKKRSGERIHLIIPNAIGDCAIVPTDIEELEAFIQKGL